MVSDRTPCTVIRKLNGGFSIVQRAAVLGTRHTVRNWNMSYCPKFKHATLSETEHATLSETGTCYTVRNLNMPHCPKLEHVILSEI